MLVLIGTTAVAAAVVYVSATVAGSLLDPHYSQIRQHVSDLTATGAATWAYLAPAYVVYNVLVLGFGIALYATSPRTVLHKIGPALLALNSFAGLMMVTWFREDMGGSPVTFGGAGHIVFASVSSLAIVVGSIVYGIAFRRDAHWRPLSVFSFAIAGCFMVLGPLAAVATAAHSDLAGLAERGPIGLFILWLGVIGTYALFRAAGRRAHPELRKGDLG